MAGACGGEDWQRILETGYNLASSQPGFFYSPHHLTQHTWEPPEPTSLENRASRPPCPYSSRTSPDRIGVPRERGDAAAAPPHLDGLVSGAGQHIPRGCQGGHSQHRPRVPVEYRQAAAIGGAPYSEGAARVDEQRTRRIHEQGGRDKGQIRTAYGFYGPAPGIGQSSGTFVTPAYLQTGKALPPLPSLD